MGGLVDARPGVGPSPSTSPSRPDNLVTVDSPGQGAMTITSTAPATAPTRRGQQRGGGLESTVRTAPVDQAGGVNLVDSFFRQSAWTREDIMVAATVVQLVAFGVLLYSQVINS
jgi:hypothetical protein